MTRKVERTERGWAGHFISASRCLFRRNTLLHSGNVRIIVSTVGQMVVGGEIVDLGDGGIYETMAFHACFDDPYWDADVHRNVDFDAEWQIRGGPRPGVDIEANDMHEAVVDEVTERIRAGEYDDSPQAE